MSSCHTLSCIYILQVHLQKIHSHRSEKTPPSVKSSNLKETVYIKIWFISDVQQIIEVPGTTSYHEIKLLEHNVEANHWLAAKCTSEKMDNKTF